MISRCACPGAEPAVFRLRPLRRGALFLHQNRTTSLTDTADTQDACNVAEQQAERETHGLAQGPCIDLLSPEAAGFTSPILLSAHPVEVSMPGAMLDQGSSKPDSHDPKLTWLKWTVRLPFPLLA